MAEEASRRELIRAAKDAARTIRADGTQWEVYELPAPNYDRRRGPCLVFERHETMRVVRRFPANWRDLADAELHALSEET